VLRLAQGLPTGDAVLAGAARIVEPGDTHRVAFFDVFDARPDGGDDAGALVAGDGRRARLHRPVAVRRVHVRVAHPRRADLHEHFARSGLGDRQLLDAQLLAELANHCRLHHLRDDRLLHASSAGFATPMPDGARPGGRLHRGRNEHLGANDSRRRKKELPHATPAS
jgi:hypothetical protein